MTAGSTAIIIRGPPPLNYRSTPTTGVSLLFSSNYLFIKVVTSQKADAQDE